MDDVFQLSFSKGVGSGSVDGLGRQESVSRYVPRWIPGRPKEMAHPSTEFLGPERSANPLRSCLCCSHRAPTRFLATGKRCSGQGASAVRSLLVVGGIARRSDHKHLGPMGPLSDTKWLGTPYVSIHQTCHDEEEICILGVGYKHYPSLYIPPHFPRSSCSYGRQEDGAEGKRCKQRNGQWR